MSESVATGLKLAAGVLITVALISIAVILWSQASGSAKTASESFAGVEKELTQQQFSAYDSTKVSGSTVSNSLRKYKDDGEEGYIGIQVKTGKNVAGTWYYSTVSEDGNTVTPVVSGTEQAIKNTKTVSHNDYINASGQFSAELVYDDSNAVRAIVFTQK